MYLAIVPSPISAQFDEYFSIFAFTYHALFEIDIRLLECLVERLPDWFYNGRQQSSDVVIVCHLSMRTLQQSSQILIMVL